MAFAAFLRGPRTDVGEMWSPSMRGATIALAAHNRSDYCLLTSEFQKNGVMIMRAVKQVGIIFILLSITVWFAVVLGADGTLPKNFPVNFIPVPKGALITNITDFNEDPSIRFAKTNTSGKEMIAFYHDSLKKTIVGLKESLSRDGEDYWFWGVFDNGNACFCLVIFFAKSTDPNDNAGGQVRVSLRKKGESDFNWKLRKEGLLKIATDAVK
jgi:hypothetical protein